MTAVLDAPLLRDLPDDTLAGLYDSSGDDTRAAVLAELGRRDRASRITRAREKLTVLRAEADLAAYAQYLEAEAACRGRMLSRDGEAAGIAETALWRLPAAALRRYASEELLDWFTWVQPRITPAAYIRQHAAAARAERAAAQDERNDHDPDHGHDSERPGVADHDPGALRPGPAAAQAPPPGPGRAVDRGRPAPPGSTPPGAGIAGGRTGGTVPPAAREDPDDMNDDDGSSSPQRAPAFSDLPAGDASPAAGTGEGGTRARTFDQVDELDQEWLWPGMIPAGLLTVIFGPPKASKTTLVADYAARVSRGDVNPDGTSLGPAAPVLLGALEDISESSTVKKLRAARADLSMVVDISGGPDGDGLELDLDHVAWLHQVAAEHPGAALIIIDTLSASATKSIVTRPGLKAMLKPLARLAENTGAAVILTCHSLKGHDDIPEGGRSLTAIPRMVLRIGRSPDEPAVRTLSVHASNVAPDSGEGYRYKLIEDGPASRLEWCWDTVRTGPGPEATGQARILLLLRNSAEPLSAQLIAARTGISYAVTRVLLSRLKKRGEVTGGPERGTWTVPAGPPHLQAV